MSKSTKHQETPVEEIVEVVEAVEVPTKPIRKEFYFFPKQGVSIEAENYTQALALMKNQQKGSDQ